MIYGTAVPAHILDGYLVEWLDRKYAVLLAFATTGLCGTLFGLATQPWEFMVFGGITTGYFRHQAAI